MRQWAVPTRALPALRSFRACGRSLSSGSTLTFAAPGAPRCFRALLNGGREHRAFLVRLLCCILRVFCSLILTSHRYLLAPYLIFLATAFAFYGGSGGWYEPVIAVLHSILPLLCVQAMSSFLREALRGRHFLALAAFFSWMEPCVVLYTDFSDTWSVPWTPSGTKCCSHFTIGCGICHAGATSAPHSEVFCSLS